MEKLKEELNEFYTKYIEAIAGPRMSFNLVKSDFNECYKYISKTFLIYSRGKDIYRIITEEFIKFYGQMDGNVCHQKYSEEYMTELKNTENAILNTLSFNTKNTKDEEEDIYLKKILSVKTKLLKTIRYRGKKEELKSFVKILKEIRYNVKGNDKINKKLAEELFKLYFEINKAIKVFDSNGYMISHYQRNELQKKMAKTLLRIVVILSPQYDTEDLASIKL